MRRRRAVRSVLVLGAAVAAALGSSIVTSAQAAPVTTVDCVANGLFSFVPDAVGGGTVHIEGAGPCTGDFRGPYRWTFSGDGTATALGACGSPPSAVILINVTIHNSLVSSKPGVPPANYDTVWDSGVGTPFPGPVAQGGTVTYGSNPPGNYRIATRVFNKCPPDGNDGAYFTTTNMPKPS